MNLLNALNITATVRYLNQANRHTPHPSPLPVEGRGKPADVPRSSAIRHRIHCPAPANAPVGARRTTLELNDASSAAPSPLNGERAGVRAGVRGENNTLGAKCRYSVKHLFVFALAGALLVGCSSDRQSIASRKPLRVLLIGGGASHDYDRWFNVADSALLNGTGRATAEYLEPQQVTVSAVQSADVLVISANKAFPDKAVRAALFAHANAGKGLVLLHPGLWYNWADWPEYNRILAGGGSRGHDRLGEFEVIVTQTGHPLMKGVPPTFKITDELYWFEPDATGTSIQILATAHSKQKKKDYPQVFVIQHPKTRIVGLTLGHDGRAHEHAAYKQLLENSVLWSARRQ